MKLHAICDCQGCLVRLLLTQGQMSDHRGAALLLPHLSPARELIGNRGYDSSPYRTALMARGIAPRIPSSRCRKIPIPHDVVLYKQRYRIENMFGRQSFKRPKAFLMR